MKTKISNVEHKKRMQFRKIFYNELQLDRKEFLKKARNSEHIHCNIKYLKKLKQRVLKIYAENVTTLVITDE